MGKDVIAVLIPEGAHHLDLRGADPMDPDSVIEARHIERKYMKKWIDQSYQDASEEGSHFGPGPDNIVPH